MRRLVWLLAGLAGGCSDTTAPQVADGELRFLRQDAAAPALLATSASFYARVGEDRGVDLYYENPAATGDTGAVLVEFDVSGSSLYRKPDGTPFAPGDSILITITVVDDSLFLFQFEPTGLRFHPQFPAQLEIEYENADHDFDDDGDEDVDDDALEQVMALWRQTTLGGPWVKLNALIEVEQDEIEAELFEFSRYAVGW